MDTFTLADRDRADERRSEREEFRKAAKSFELVGDLPKSPNTSHYVIPEVRQQLVKFAKANRDSWIKYMSSPEDPFPRPSSITSMVKRGSGGFGKGFEAVVRNGDVFVRYVG